MPAARTIPPDVAEALADYLAEATAERVGEQLGIATDQVKPEVKVEPGAAPEAWTWTVTTLGISASCSPPAWLEAYNVDRQSWGTRVLREADRFAQEIADRVQLAGARRCQQTAETCAAPACSTHARPS